MFMQLYTPVFEIARASLYVMMGLSAVLQRQSMKIHIILSRVLWITEIISQTQCLLYDSMLMKH